MLLLFKYLIKIVLIQITTSNHIHQIILSKKSLITFHNNESNNQIIDPTNPYCSICCVDINQHHKGRKCGIHTMCAYALNKIGAGCKGLIIMDFSQNEIDTIVDVHNTLRNRIALGYEEHGNPGPQPAASNMRLISWDNELANIALLWATQCVYNHDACRDLKRFPVGQNIAEGNYASKNDLQFIADWYELVHFVNRDMIGNFDPKKFEGLLDYSQLVWADTYLVGCARVSFQKSTNKGQMVYTEHFFCNYGPSGNIPNQCVYKIGKACSACSEGTFCTNPEYPGLCDDNVLNETFFDEKRRMLKANKNQIKLNANNMGINSKNLSLSWSLFGIFIIIINIIS